MNLNDKWTVGRQMGRRFLRFFIRPAGTVTSLRWVNLHAQSVCVCRLCDLTATLSGDVVTSQPNARGMPRPFIDPIITVLVTPPKTLDSL